VSAVGTARFGFDGVSQRRQNEFPDNSRALREAYGGHRAYGTHKLSGTCSQP